jgi:hypothetical protein
MEISKFEEIEVVRDFSREARDTSEREKCSRVVIALSRSNLVKCWVWKEKRRAFRLCVPTPKTGPQWLNRLRKNAKNVSSGAKAH